MRKKIEVFSAKTGTGTSIEVLRRKLMPMGRRPVMAKLTLTYGLTPTITVKLQGTNDGGTTWSDCVSGVFTTGTPKYLHAPAGKHYRRYRLNITANTNVTVDKGYIGIGRVED